jgi:hypothetical protein
MVYGLFVFVLWFLFGRAARPVKKLRRWLIHARSKHGAGA